MPKKNNCGAHDLSEYDEMSSEELAEILRLDSEMPEGNALDIDTLLYITGILAERQNNSTGKTAQDAWISFRQHYMSSEEDNLDVSDTAEKTKPVKSRKPWVRRVIGVAAVVALVVLVPLTAKALRLDEVWSTVVIWAKETFSFAREGQSVDAPSPSSEIQSKSLQQALEDRNQDTKMIPTWIPDGFTLDNVDIIETPEQRDYIAFYKNGEKSITIGFCVYNGTDPIRIEINEHYSEIYNVNGIDYYIYENNAMLSVAWSQEFYDGCITGEISIEELKKMIDSIPKG